MEIMKGGN